MRAVAYRTLIAIASVALVPACRSRSSADVAPGTDALVSAPARDVGDRCSDVADLRVCWGARRVLRVTRSSGPHDTAAAPFVCNGKTCVQSYPRQPDDGEWTCSDDSGATVCVGRQPAAGVAEAEGVHGWWCGARRMADGSGDRVCVDFSPDLPAARSVGQRCRWTYDRGVRRECRDDPDARVLGDPCAGGRPCVDGALCVFARCVPPMPEPSCWLDGDCGAGARCRFGTCSVPTP